MKLLPGARPCPPGSDSNSPVGPWEPLWFKLDFWLLRLAVERQAGTLLCHPKGVTRGVRERLAPCHRPPLGARTRRRDALSVIGKLQPSSDSSKPGWSWSECRKVTADSVELRTNGLGNHLLSSDGSQKEVAGLVGTDPVVLSGYPLFLLSKPCPATVRPDHCNTN